MPLSKAGTVVPLHGGTCLGHRDTAGPPCHKYTVPELGVSISCVTEFILNAFFMLKEKLGEIAYKVVFMNLSLDFIPLPEDERFRPSNAAHQRTSHQWQRGLHSWDKKHC